MNISIFKKQTDKDTVNIKKHTKHNVKMETQLKSVMLFLLINLNSLVKDVWTDSKAKPGSIWFIKDYP